MKFSIRIAIASLVFLLAFNSQGLRAQNSTSSVQGSVTDSTGAVVPDSSITLINNATGVKQVTRSDSDGNYSFPTVAPGLYTLEVAKPGFAGYTLAGFSVVVGQHQTQNAKLNIAAAATTVTVDASGLSNVLQTESNDLGSVIGPQSVSQLPLNGRNFLQLGLLSGTTQSNFGASNGTASQTDHPALSINVAGNEPDFTMYLINGIQTVGSRANNTSLNLSISAIDQFEVHYGFFMPDLGASPGIIDVVTKGGTNHIHGEAFEYVRNNQMEARNWFSTLPNGPYHQNQFGADAGGPILHNRLFYFGDYEGYRQIQNGFTGALTPTQAMFNGDFSTISTPIYDPATYNPTTGTRQQFSGNIIPAGRINSVSKNLLAYYLPGATATVDGHNIGGNPLTTLYSDQITGRIDYSVNDSNQIFAQGSWLKSPATNDGLFQGTATTFPMDTEFVATGWNWTLSPTKVNSLSLGVVRDSVFEQGQTINDIQAQLGITGTSDANGIPGVGITGYAGFGNSTGLLGDIDNSYQVHDSFNWLHGNHQIKMGASLNYIRSIQSSANLNARGIMQFNATYSTQTKPAGVGKVAPVAGTGNAFADFLLGDPANAHSQGMPPMHVRWTEFEPYIQDSWKITKTLNASLAFAWYTTTPPNPSDKTNRDLIHGFDFNTGLVTFAALGTANPHVYNITLNDFAPRVGLTWQPPIANTVVRAGWGMYYTTPMEFGLQYAVVSQIITVNNQVTNTSNLPQPAYVLGVNILPPVTVGQITAAQVPTIKGALLYESADTRTPSIPQWNLDVQHTFGKSYLLDVAYIGNEGHHLAKLFNPFDCSTPGQQTCDTATEPFYPTYSYMQEMSTIGYSTYQALLVKFQRQFSNGLSILGNYTWEKAISNSNSGNNGTLSQDRSCIRCDKGLAPMDIPQSLVISAVWDLPLGRDRHFGANMNRILNGAVGDWSIDAIITMQKGSPFTVTAPNHVAWPADQIRADRYCNGRNELQNKNLRANGLVWFDTSCFVDPATDPHNTSGSQWYFGTSGFDILTGPGINNWDMGIHKNFPIHDNVTFAMRGEFFNAWNHASFANPVGGIGSSNFGTVTSTQHDPRQVQIGATLSF